MPKEQTKLSDLTNAQVADHLYNTANKLCAMWGKNPDADVIREAANRYWKDGKADEEKASRKAPKKTSTTVKRKAAK